MTYQEKAQIEARISKLDYEMTKEVLHGYRPFYGDKFQPLRDEILKLRCQIMPNSVFCTGVIQG